MQAVVHSIKKKKLAPGPRNCTSTRSSYSVKTWVKWATIFVQDRTQRCEISPDLSWTDATTFPL